MTGKSDLTYGYINILLRGGIEMKGFDTYKLKSYEELFNAVEMGLDIEFFIGETRYNISWRKKPFICICPYGDAIFFNDAADLLENYKINGKSLKELWQSIDIYSM
jgi:hypothetical protein